MKFLTQILGLLFCISVLFSFLSSSELSRNHLCSEVIYSPNANDRLEFNEAFQKTIS